MKVINIINEDFTNYKKAAMFIITSRCDGKCWSELGLPKNTCQNHSLYGSEVKEVTNKWLVGTYLNNPITHAVVFGGLEPLLDLDDLNDFIKIMREDYNCSDDIVVYTGYREDEKQSQIFITKNQYYPNIYVKFGRYIPNIPSIYDSILGVTLASENQYAKCISKCICEVKE